MHLKTTKRPVEPTRKMMQTSPSQFLSSASLGNILMIAIDLGCVNEPGSVSMMGLRADGPARDVSSQNRVDPPKRCQISAPPDLGRIQVYKYWLYM